MIFVLCAAAAYAQVGVSSIPVTTVRSTGRAELAGAVRLTASGPTVADTFTVRYGIPITNGKDTVTPGSPINISGTWPGCSVYGVDYTNGIVTVNCGIAAAGNYFQLDGVRVSADGFAGNAVTATIGALQTPITAGQNSATVIESVASGLKLALAGQQTLTFLASSKTATTTPGILVLSEGFASAWKTQTDELAGATQATKILLTLSPALPAGYTVTMEDAGFNPLSGLPYTSATLAYTPTTATFTSTTTQQTIIITAENLAAVETLGLKFTLGFDLTVGLPLPPADFFITATLTPNDPALTTLGLPYAPYLAPKFAVANQPSDAGQKIITVVPASTTLLIPYATTDAGYDSGIAIANTTTDPFPTTPPPPTQSATKQNGTVKFYFFPNDGSTIAPYSPTGTGQGLTAGLLNSGSTYVTLLSSLLSAAGRTTPFTGYVIAVVGSNQCHGAAFISDFTGKFTSASPVLVIPNPAVTKRAGVADEMLAE